MGGEMSQRAPKHTTINPVQDGGSQKGLPVFPL